ncbi:MAG: 16S rRNA (guanine(527)-N(7))-methyltransferase RsmG [Dehalococcoidia bacterium]|nr:16S rRNA (guanine(527)-N(7))-methyltransferase RsmG [Dehalococcoidia bacterium]
MERDSAGLGISLDSTQLDKFRWYYREMTLWNSTMNLTTVTGWEDVVKTHFLDSLAIAGALPAETRIARSFIDIGAGAGFPGIPIKIAFPGQSGMLVDATAKKVEFLKNLVAGLELPDIEVRHARAETLAHCDDARERFDLVFARAVAAMPVLAELTLPFCRVGGVAALHKTKSAAEEIASSHRAIETMGGAIRDIIRAGGDNKVLVVIDKVRDTPANYPRRPGIPAKRPLLSASDRSSGKAPHARNNCELITCG